MLTADVRLFRVLIVEDTSDRQGVLRSLYKNQAWVMVHTGRRALKLLEAYEFDIVSLDYNLADELTGADVAAAPMARSNERMRRLRAGVDAEGPRYDFSA
jgi:CheY-like chemotaxis protein